MTRHLREIGRELRAQRWQRTPEGILLPRMHALLQGVFAWRGHQQHNLLTDQCLALIAADLFPAAFYAAMFANNVVPVTTWTGATFAGIAGEITSTSEGYIEATRPALLDLGGGSPAEFNMRSVTQVTVYGFGVLDGNTRGGVGDNLIGAILFASGPEAYDDHDIADLYYTVTPVPV